MSEETGTDVFDVLIIGAGLSGIGAACHLRRECPGHSLAVLEARACSGGTWDLFRYPGIRSDSDMHTLGYDFRPWREAKAIADGPSILRYVRDTAREEGVEDLIHYRQRVRRADWDSAAQCWTLLVEAGEEAEPREWRARFLLVCAGYYSYSRGHQPDFPGRADFRGEFLHPQFWPGNLDYRGKRVVVIGSGATAMTLVPAMAEQAAEVVMLQRSPTYVISRPARDRLANTLRRLLPEMLAYRLTRWKNTHLQRWVYQRSRRAPQKVRRLLLARVRRELGDAAMADFTPRYDPWDQRLCLVPDGDLYAALRSGRARVVTAAIERITADGIRLASGEQLPADVIVSATGLELELMGGVEFRVDGELFDFPASWSYRGMMCSGLPNLVSVFGYINASWTLRADIVARWCCRLLNHMREQGAAVACPQLREDDRDMPPRPWIEGFSAGYMQRVLHRFPKQGDREPWINSQDYFRERLQFAADRFDDGALQFTARSPAAPAQAPDVAMAS
jgi:cation diffusion facilitator CzcD-associated flavoprotein CzcO